MSVRRLALWLGMLVFCALVGMMAHELGHALVAEMMGLQVAKVIWGPVGTGEISRTILMDWPRPAMVVWGGFVMGAGLPMIAWCLAMLVRWRWGYFLRFFAGFCLVGNGAYLATGWLESTADGGELLRAGVPQWVMVGAGVVLVVAGLGVWHRLSAKFERITWAQVACVWGVSGGVIAVQALLNRG